MRSQGDKSERQPLLSQDDLAEISRLFAERIKQRNNETPILSSFPEKQAATLLDSGYKVLAEAVDPDAVLQALTSIYGADINQ